MPLSLNGQKPEPEREDTAALAEQLAVMSNAEIAAYVQAAVTDLASARLYLIRLTRIVRTLARRAAR